MRNRIYALLAVTGLVPGMLGLWPAGASAATRDSVHQFMDGTLAFSPADAWAVGWGGIGTSSASDIALHWNGTQWVDTKPVQEGLVNGMDGVSGTSSSDVWAVGFNLGVGLIEHYNGSKWATVTPPDNNDFGQLNAVSARTASDAWAAGFFSPGSNQIPFTIHWNGTKWSQVNAAPVSGQLQEFSSVADLGSKDVFAVGNYTTESKGVFTRHEMAQQWNGTAWQRVSVPTFSGASALTGVAGTSSGVMAVGWDSVSGHDVPLIERWNGTKFVQVTQPVGTGDLGGVTMLSGTSAYAVGETGSGAPLVEHYNGTAWTQVTVPSPADGGFLAAVAADPAGNFAEAAGWHSPDPNERALIEQGNGQTWQITRQ